MIIKIIIIAVFLNVVSGCVQNKYIAPPTEISASAAPTVQKLNAFYNDWRGVKYREGGMTKQGVDCSAFVQLAYQQKLHKKIPRSTKLMSETGKQVSMRNLQPGDVVFFKTGFKTRHVGVYVGKNEFIHASSSRGVMKSKLNNPYWIEHYWMSRRYDN